ncbi:hypothetical protein Ddye_026056 [Dipteronia dyeriana]|uniref:Uncharacterized protein n=1 Tax=Dipteronia dyeriana TaxID=168575 RepID=A0AAD9TLJ6_9ROSI|nr:hypothetical protein Ddye_026056 [Dipteronia dyeriana]
MATGLFRNNLRFHCNICLLFLCLLSMVDKMNGKAQKKAAGLLSRQTHKSSLKAQLRITQLNEKAPPSNHEL